MLLLDPGSALAQLSGTVGPDFTSLAQAVAALESAGVAGPVTLNLRAGTYAGGGGSERALYISADAPGIARRRPGAPKRRTC